MRGFQVTVITEQNGGSSITSDGLAAASGERVGISGATVFTGAESYGADGRRHSARFIELTDQPVEIMMAVTEEQASLLFERINAMDTRCFT